MRVVEVTRFGGPEVLVPTEAADPVAAPGQVVVDVSAADVLFVETRIRRGGGGRYFDVTPPYVPGGGVAGRVRSVGEGVDPGWVGRPVVTSTAARGKRKLDLILELGADAAVDYSQPDWTERVREATGGAGPDVVFDGAGGQIGLAAFEATARGRLERALAEAAAGRIRPVIGQTFPLERAADAHAAIESRDVLGKTLLVI